MRAPRSADALRAVCTSARRVVVGMNRGARDVRPRAQSVKKNESFPKQFAGHEVINHFLIGPRGWGMFCVGVYGVYLYLRASIQRTTMRRRRGA